MFVKIEIGLFLNIKLKIHMKTNSFLKFHYFSSEFFLNIFARITYLQK